MFSPVRISRVSLGEGGLVHTYGKSFLEENVTTVAKSAHSQYNPLQTTGAGDLSCRFEIPHKELSQHNTV